MLLFLFLFREEARLKVPACNGRMITDQRFRKTELPNSAFLFPFPEAGKIDPKPFDDSLSHIQGWLLSEIVWLQRLTNAPRHNPSIFVGRWSEKPHDLEIMRR